MLRYQPLLFQPVPSLLGYSLTTMVEEIRAAHFPQLVGDQIEVRIAAEGPLAYVKSAFMGPGRHLVVFHPILNHPQTPLDVMRFISKHELTHLVIPPRLVGSIFESHPPEFWVAEAEMGPERFAVWAWIHQNLRKCARNTRRGYSVSRKWQSLREAPRTPYTPSLPFNGERWDRICPGDGAQLQLPPDWPARPLPLLQPGKTRHEARGRGPILSGAPQPISGHARSGLHPPGPRHPRWWPGAGPGSRAYGGPADHASQALFSARRVYVMVYSVPMNA